MLKNLNSQFGSTPLVLSSSLRYLVYMYLSQRMSTFTNYLKVHRSLDGYFILLGYCYPEEPVIHDHIYILIHLCLQT